MNPNACRLSLAALAILLAVGCTRSPADEPGLGTSESSPSSSAAVTRIVGSIDLDSAFIAAQDVYFEGEYDSARHLLRDLEKRARLQDAPDEEGRALTWHGYAAWRLGLLVEAWDVGQHALALKLRHDLTAQVPRSYNQLGLVAWHQGRLVEAVELFDRGLEIARANGYRSMEPSLVGNRALALTDLGRFEEARRGFLDQRAIARETKNVLREGDAVNNLGSLEIRAGNPAAAIPLLEEARELYDLAEYPTGQQNNLGQFGTAYAALGETAKAFAVLDTALAEARRQGLRQDEASDLEALAELARDVGDFRRALDFYAQAKAINEELGLDLETGADLRGEAEINLTLENLQGAYDMAAEALAIHTALDARYETLSDHLMIAQIANRLGRDQETAEHLQAAHALADSLDARSGRIGVVLTEAQIADHNRQWQRVLEIMQGARSDLSRGGFVGEWQAHLLEARAHSRLGDVDSAIVVGRRALRAVERVRANLRSGIVRSAYLADRREVYTHLVSALLRQGRVEEAFEVADAARGRSLRGHAPGRASESLSPTSGALVEAERLLRELDELMQSIETSEAVPPEDRSPEQRSALDRLYDRADSLRTTYETILVRTASADPTTAAFLGGADVRASEVRHALRPGELLVEYFVTGDRVILFAASRNEIRVHESAIDVENLASRIRLARGMLRRTSDTDKNRRVLSGLFDLLVGPLARSGGLAGVERLLLVPDEVLNYLAFAALRDPITDRYLVEDYAIQLLPSAAALPVLRSRQTDVGTAGMRGGMVYAPFPDALPATRREAETVATRTGAQPAAGRRATEASVRLALGQPGVVHIASHGVLNPRNPLFSRIQLSRGANGGSADDGRLEVHELMDLSVRAPVVFLSGCETGVGIAWSTRFARGEEYATLAQSFLIAGSQSVIATLWPIEDDGAAAFAEVFYGALWSEESALALAKAQRAMLLHDRYSAPYYWAAYQLVGNGLETIAQ